MTALSPRHIVAALWTLGILVALALPGQNLPDTDFAGADKLVHALLFAGFGLLWFRALCGQPLGRRTGWVLGAGLAFAVGSEVAQGLLPLRTADPYDALSNATGLLAAVLACRSWAKRRAPSSS